MGFWRLTAQRRVELDSGGRMFYFCSGMSGDGVPLHEPVSSAETPEEMRLAHGRMLRRLAEICLKVAEGIGEEVDAARAEGVEPEPAPLSPLMQRLLGNDIGLSLSRIGRTLRLTLALERRMAGEDFTAAEQQKAEAARLRAEAQARREVNFDVNRETKQQAIVIAKAMTEEHLGEARLRETGRESELSQAERDALFRDLDERLWDDSDLEALDDYTVVDLVALMCAELGAPFNRADWADEEDLRGDWLGPDWEPPPRPITNPPNHPNWRPKPPPEAGPAP
jgi:hypothetical protein